MFYYESQYGNTHGDSVSSTIRLFLICYLRYTVCVSVIIVLSI